MARYRFLLAAGCFLEKKKLGRRGVQDVVFFCLYRFPHVPGPFVTVCSLCRLIKKNIKKKKKDRKKSFKVLGGILGVLYINVMFSSRFEKRLVKLENTLCYIMLTSEKMTTPPPCVRRRR